MADRFAGVSLQGWRQFSTVQLQFDSRLCVLTGPNGCGKTTILNVLGKHFGWNINFVSAPYISRRNEKKLWDDVDGALDRDFNPAPGAQKVGSIRYQSGRACELLAPPRDSAQYSLQYSSIAEVQGLNIPSHRPVATYVAISNIPTDPKTSQQQFQEFQQLMLQVYGAENARNPGRVLKQSLMALAAFGYDTPALRGNRLYRELYEGFQDVLRKLLPKSIGFQRLEIRNPEVVLITETGDFPLDAMSGGVAAIFGMAWQIFMYGYDKTECTVLIDEPENHLHPSMQREFLPALGEAFPGYQFIVATHSPFIVTSAAHAIVYALVYEDDGKGESRVKYSRRKIHSMRIDDANLSGSPNRILREILDVPTTLPIWVEQRLSDVLERYAGGHATSDAAKLAFAELRELGLTEALADYPSGVRRD
jgi:predicted ATPase